MRASTFYFDSFDLDTTGGMVRYHYSTDKGHVFTHELSFAFPKESDSEALLGAVFALGMAELPHYWKALLTPSIVIKAGALSAEQVAFWENLYTKGLGEFFFVNNIDFRNLVHITSESNAPVFPPHQGTASKKALVPFGGGKDSLVTGEFLKKLGRTFSWFELEPLPFSSALQEKSGITSSSKMGRDVAKNFAPILELVKNGAPNGHVPITATYIFSAVLAGKATGYSDIVLSIERSASEGNTDYLGMDINHQYTKSFEFENMVAKYVRTYIDSSMRVFSLVRPLYEIQIIQEFVKYPGYFSSFVSCNKGLKTGTWCGVCAKCAFIFAGLSAFLAPSEVEKIFGKNLFEDETLISLYKDLVGLGTMKPFDCVGTFKENMLALYLSGEQYKKVNLSIPLVLSMLPIEQGRAHLALLDAATSEHLIPKEYQNV